MTPIKEITTPIKLGPSGEYAVFPTKDGRYVVCKLAKEGDRSPLFVGLVVSPGVNVYLDKSVHATLPMALRVAAEAAGIERQRVVVEGDRILTRRPDSAALAWATSAFWSDRGEQETLGDLAHFDARRRYAALGGAA